jgi:hypothetical protein
MTATWSQSYLLFGERLAISAVITAAPVLTLLFLLSVLRKPACLAGGTGLAVTFVLAVAEYSMPVGMSLNGATSGIAFSLFPISWIVFWGVMLYPITVETAKFEIISAHARRCGTPVGGRMRRVSWAVALPQQVSRRSTREPRIIRERGDASLAPDKLASM